MKKWIFTFIIIFLIFSVSYFVRTENKLTVQEKHGKANYQYVAYKEKIDEENAKAIKKELRKGDWKNSKIKLNKKPSDYIFYFNEPKEDGDASVYHIWLKADPLQVKVYSGKKEMKLEGEAAETLVKNVLDVEYYR